MFLNPQPLAALALATLAATTLAAQAQTAPAPGAAKPQRVVRTAALGHAGRHAPAAVPAAAPAAATEIAAAPRVSPPPCTDVQMPEPFEVAVGKTRHYAPAAPVVRIIAGNASSGVGVPGGGVAADPLAAVADKIAGVNSRLAPTPGGSGRPMQLDAQPVSARPGVADVDVQLLSPTDLYLTGNAIGTTNFVMVHQGGRCTMVNVVVAMDPDALQNTIRRLLPAESGIVISSAFDSLVLSGSVTDSEALAQITDLANAYLRGGEGGGGGGARNPRIVNMLEVGSPQQVMLEVKVAEVSKNLLDQFGIDFSRAYVPGDGSLVRFLSGILGGSAGITGQIGGTNRGVPFSSVDAVVGGSVSGAFGNATTGSGVTSGNVTVTYDNNGRPTYTTSYGTVPGRNVTNIGLNMQKTDGLVRVLAEPSVMAISGQTGSFLAGGKIFIPIASSNDNGGRTITLEEKVFGVSLKFTPTVLGGRRINLRVKPEVSELNAAGVTISGVGGTAVLPSFTSRMAETTVQLSDGQSFAIGGLIKANTTTNIKAFPFLGELPIVGALFRSTEFQTDRSELVFVITPRLVKPLPADYRLPTDGYVPPTRRELIFEGKTEGARPAPADSAAARSGFDRAPAEAPAVGGFDVSKGDKK